MENFDDWVWWRAVHAQILWAYERFSCDGLYENSREGHSFQLLPVYVEAPRSLLSWQEQAKCYVRTNDSSVRRAFSRKCY